MAKSKEDRLEEIQNEIFENSLIVGRICSFASLADVLNLRLVNHLFQREATKSLWKVHKHIVLNTNQRIQALYELMKKRRTLRLLPFPFSAFNLELSLSRLTLQIFSLKIGRYIQRYSFQAKESWCNRQSSVQIGSKVVMLLSGSQQVTEFLLDSTYEVYVSEQDLVHIANNFPRLRVIGMESREHSACDPPGSLYPLIDVLISRTWGLKVFKIPAALPDLSWRNIHFLLTNRPNNLPYFSLEESQALVVYSDDTSLVQKFIDRNVRFREISVVVRENQCQEYGEPGASDEEVQHLVDIVSTWLGMQSGSLKNLCIKISYHSEKGGPFPFPSLPVLENLVIKFPPATCSIVLPFNSQPIELFIENPFPALWKLRLDDYRNDFGIFGICSMTSVRQLELRRYRSRFPEMTCHLTFPNLTSLHISVEPNLETLFKATLIYALTHLTQLVNLDLEVTATKNGHTGPVKSEVMMYDYWAILSGGAPESYRNLVLSGTGGWVNRVPEEPVNGIYQVPSLRNMTSLQSLRLFPRLGSNLDAIMFMSQTGQLVPLQKLTLSCLEQDIEITKRQREIYRQGLSRIHKKVHFFCRCSQQYQLMSRIG